MSSDLELAHDAANAQAMGDHKRFGWLFDCLPDQPGAKR